MNSQFWNVIITAIGFSWPVLLGFAGTVTPFQVYVGTAISGLTYFAIMVSYGVMEVGAISFWPTIVIFACGIVNAIGFQRYVMILPNPIQVGIALALTQILVVFGCTILHRGGLEAITAQKMIGLIFASIGIYLMNVN